MNKRKYWKDLTEEDFDFIKKAYEYELPHEERCDIISKKYGGVSHRTIRGWWQKLGVNVPSYILPSQLEKAKNKNLDLDADILLVTSAQCKTDINYMMFKSMLGYKEFIEKHFDKKVSIVVCPLRYRNPTSPEETAKQKAGEWWDKRILDYLYYDNLYFGDCMISALSRVQPTARRPLSGFEVLSNESHVVLGHPKYQMKVLPRYSDEDIHILTTSGSLTVKNYSDTKAGEHGDIHHVYGFTVIEKDDINPDKCLVPRFVNCTSTGDFTDLNVSFKNGEFQYNDKCEAIVLGDIHARNLDIDCIDATYDLLDRLTPKNVFLHDVFDGSTVNPHEEKDLYVKKRKIAKGQFQVKEEVDQAITFVGHLKTYLNTSKIYVVESNHDVFLDRWVNNFNWKKDLHTSESYLHYAKIQQDNDLSEYGNIFGFELMNTLKDKRVEYIPYGKSVRIKGILCSMHGDFGINGARGSATSFGRLPSKSITGHTHSHQVFNGAYVVGVTCRLEQHYNRKGLSSWSQGHCLIYENGKRQQIIFNKDYKITNLIY